MWGRRCSLAALTASLLLLAVLEATAQGEQRSVLTLYSQRRENPVPSVLDPLLQEILVQRLPGVDYYTEFFDAARFAEPEYHRAIGDFLKHKYAGRRFDVLITPSSAAMGFVKAYRNELFAGVPVVFATNPSAATELGLTKATGVTSTSDLSRTLTLVTQLQPKTKRVFVVSGSSPFDKAFEDSARTRFRAFEARFEFTYWSGLPMKELLERVANLPPDSILFPLMITQDRTGRRYVPFDQIELLAATANVPVYAFASPQMGRGVIGGVMSKPELQAGPLVDLVVRVLGGENPENIPVATVDLSVSEVDWRQLRRFGISEARVPAGTTVRFREPGLWERYRSYIIGTVILLLLQTTLIAGLLVQRVRRRRVEDALRQSEGALRESSRQNQDLAGRLITAQEMERARIARELHDDVCQRLAGLSIVLGGFRRRISESRSESDVDETLAMIQNTTSSLSNDVRHLSHELHSGVLQYAGLAAALKEHCSEFGRHHQLDISVNTADNIGALGNGIALCLYRVTQEALANTAHHAQARVAQVRLARTPHGVELDVVDDGVGFDPEHHHGRGLGLQSIGERVRLAKGSVRIESQPGHGTRVSVRIPLASVPIEIVAPAAS